MTKIAFIVLVSFIVVGAVHGSTFDFKSNFFANTNRSQLRENLRYLTSAPHIAGSVEDYESALWVLSKFKEYGLEESWIESYDVLLNYPLRRTVQIIAPSDQFFIAQLTEPVVLIDPTSSDPRAVPTYNGYAPTAIATGELVYVNYGRLEDFKRLRDLGIDLTGKIAIVRYGYIFRGVKVMLAQENGCKGVLIYSDPADDGFVKGDVFPEGVYRPEYAVQRGSVAYSPRCPGDPRRVLECLGNSSIDYVGTLIPNIAVQPLSWGDAFRLLKGIGGQVIDEWQGGLNFTYHVGPGPVVVHMDIEMNFTVTPIWNVMARISGSDGDAPNRTVLVGNHRDAWVFGAADPSSGTSALLEVARVFGVMLQNGWKPKRDIIIGNWDGEEHGLLGSTAYGEKYAKELQETTVAYVNVDIGVGGHLMNFGCSASLGRMVSGVFQSVPYNCSSYPEYANVYDSWDKNVNVLGAGSDFAVFLDHLGIASMDIGFEGSRGGTYHSNYDSFYLMDQLVDPGFYMHESMTRVLGLVVQQLADAKVLPMNYSDTHEQLNSNAMALESLANPTAGLDFSALHESIASFKTKASSVESDISCFSDPPSGEVCKDVEANVLSDRLMNVERQFLADNNMPWRPWFKHVVQATGYYNGYGGEVFPGLGQMIREENWEEARRQLNIIADQVRNAASSIQPTENTVPKSESVKYLAVIVVVVVAVFVGVAYFIIRRQQRAHDYSHLDKQSKMMMDKRQLRELESFSESVA